MIEILNLNKIKFILLSANGPATTQVPKVDRHMCCGPGPSPHQQGVWWDAGQTQQPGVPLSHMREVSF